MKAQELEQYRLIKYGWLKFILGAIAAIVLVLNGLWLVMSLHEWIPDLPGDLEIFPGVLLGAAVMFGVSIYATNGARQEWLRDYWRRNVVGHDVVFWRGSDGLLGTKIVRRGDSHDGPEFDSVAFSILIPLGGWGGNRARIIRENVDASKNFKEWRVEVVAIHAHTGGITLLLTDRTGDRVKVDLVHAFEILDVVAEKFGASTNDWGTVLVDYVFSVQELKQDLATVKAALEDEREAATALEMINRRLRDDVGYLHGIIEDTIRSIGDTTRLGKSKDAKRICLKLVHVLLGRLPPDDPRRPWLEAEKNRRMTA